MLAFATLVSKKQTIGAFPLLPLGIFTHSRQMFVECRLCNVIANLVHHFVNLPRRHAGLRIGEYFCVLVVCYRHCSENARVRARAA